MNEDETKNLPTTSPPSLEGLSWLDRSLRIFTDVRRGEGLTGVIMLASVFFILTAYYLFKPAREGLLATAGVEAISKIELKAYLFWGDYSYIEENKFGYTVRFFHLPGHDYQSWVYLEEVEEQQAHRRHRTSVRTIPWLVSSRNSTRSGATASQKLGQPHPASNFVVEAKSS